MESAKIITLHTICNSLVSTNTSNGSWKWCVGEAVGAFNAELCTWKWRPRTCFQHFVYQRCTQRSVICLINSYRTSESLGLYLLWIYRFIGTSTLTSKVYTEARRWREQLIYRRYPRCWNGHEKAKYIAFPVKLRLICKMLYTPTLLDVWKKIVERYSRSKQCAVLNVWGVGHVKKKDSNELWTYRPHFTCYQIMLSRYRLTLCKRGCSTRDVRCFKKWLSIGDKKQIDNGWTQFVSEVPRG